MTTITTKLSRLSKGDRKSLLWGLLFISPWILGFLFFTFYPLLASGYYSLTRYDLIREPVFVGLKNYKDLFLTDPHFWNVMWNTVFYVFLSVPLGIGTAFLIATLLNSKIIGRSFFRGIIYIPSIVPAVCTSMVWMFLLNIQYGAINAVLTSLGLNAIPFLSNPVLAKPSLVVVSMWTQGAAVVIFLAALQEVPRTLYEAATVDGANNLQKFWNVTIPMTTPVILFNLIMGFITAFQTFTIPWLLTGGGPMNSTEFYSIHLYRNAFIYLRMGKASALAWILFFIIAIFTIILFKTSARWVYYGGEE
ncbi:MAG: sugar ABC transporter permease [Chloroflexota bacterium]